jgi:CRP-like cAMP-binding protein
LTADPLGRRLSSADLALLEPAGRSERIARRAIVPLDGPALVIVLDGYFRIFRNAAFVRDVTLGLASQGDILAPGAAFGDRCAETGAEALAEGGRVLFLSAEAWEARAASDAGLWLKMAGSVGRRVARMQQKLEEFNRSGVEARVAAALLELAGEFGTPVESGERIDLPLSQEDLARLAGTTRETCSSTVAAFTRRGLVRGRRLRGLVVLDRPGLERLRQAGL